MRGAGNWPLATTVLQDHKHKSNQMRSKANVLSSVAVRRKLYISYDELSSGANSGLSNCEEREKSEKERGAHCEQEETRKGVQRS